MQWWRRRESNPIKPLRESARESPIQHQLGSILIPLNPARSIWILGLERRRGTYAQHENASILSTLQVRPGARELCQAALAVARPRRKPSWMTIKAMPYSVPEPQLLRFLSQLVECCRFKPLTLIVINLIARIGKLQRSSVRNRQAPKR